MCFYRYLQLKQITAGIALKDFRQKFLKNTYYKFLAFIFARRLQKLLINYKVRANMHISESKYECCFRYEY